MFNTNLELFFFIIAAMNETRKLYINPYITISLQIFLQNLGFKILVNIEIWKAKVLIYNCT